MFCFELRDTDDVMHKSECCLKGQSFLRALAQWVNFINIDEWKEWMNDWWGAGIHSMNLQWDRKQPILPFTIHLTFFSVPNNTIDTHAHTDSNTLLCSLSTTLLTIFLLYIIYINNDYLECLCTVSIITKLCSWTILAPLYLSSP